MKKIFIMALLCSMTNYLQGQNTFPSSGNVGIGSLSPQNALDVNGNISVSAQAGLLTNSYYSSGFKYLANGYAAQQYISGADGHYSFYLSPNNTSGFGAAATQSEVLTLTQSGNVGIGTASPTAKLTIAGSGNLNPNTGVETDYNGLNLTFKGESGGSGFNLGSIKMVQPATAYIDAADMVFSTSYGVLAEKMRITREGNVGIGTTTPDAKLAVNGTIHSKVVKVDFINWPDYVFKPSYTLTPLSQVKTYIDQYHHLPDMPSAKEVAEKGLDLGEIVKLQTKKIEELTLYLIERDKKIEGLEQRLNKLENTKKHQ